MADDFYTDLVRRNFIKISAVGVALTPLANLLMGTNAQARSGRQDPPYQVPALSESDPQAKALHYTEDATTASPVGRKESQFCQNCQLYSGDPGAEWGPCAIFSYRTNPKTNTAFVVNAQGWCQAWGPRASAR